ncbi:class I SAM-dependent methyltransferase [Glaciecola petra]|uniref:Ribosomal RNA small subunit methyltransferase J n=1 Tax=Glaciecola petra TaxID=3075602 RepID=A0ABU2ZVF7_9ALTE|nr:class I SAM-dependent methyltransferase [Aestuariibacter sp. P117]MDT0596390.1 class I SAM-dependent methyltransferase [Aestuariibacter sp. P117]
MSDLSNNIKDTVVLIEDNGSIYANEHAKKLAAKLSLPLHTIPANKKKQPFVGAQWQLVYTEQGLALRVASEPTWSDIRVDFASDALAYRKAKGGGRNEALAKAIGIKGKDSLQVLDCTAGMGTDSFVMASVGANVTMLERSPIIAALIEDALNRAALEKLNVCQNMQFIQANAIDFLKSANTDFDVIYLDPMFPHKKKSALVKKEMRAFQLLLGPDQDSSALFEAAISASPSRIVIKRPSTAPALRSEQNIAPNMAIHSKKHRYDVYLFSKK